LTEKKCITKERAAASYFNFLKKKKKQFKYAKPIAQQLHSLQPCRLNKYKPVHLYSPRKRQHERWKKKQ